MDDNLDAFWETLLTPGRAPKLEPFVTEPLSLNPNALLPSSERPYHYCSDVAHIAEFFALGINVGQISEEKTSFWDLLLRRRPAIAIDLPYDQNRWWQQVLAAAAYIGDGLEPPPNGIEVALRIGGAGLSPILYKCLLRGDPVTPALATLARMHQEKVVLNALLGVAVQRSTPYYDIAGHIQNPNQLLLPHVPA